ncbi:hypothetical protein O181_008443 [Austropuccinia psidii MF-1]|uniref:Uncharacterized protein n=1 Tax=Austropuccinia psidii MF-1 TaxID=1389203 RepID=A0A9Q3GII2_9BASI|nr:hypothetical protein [Austropuccinia psidii MF-1]
MPPFSSHHALDNSNSKAEAAEDIPNLILSLTQQMRKMQSDHAAEMAFLHSSLLSSPNPASLCSHVSSSAYDNFISDPQKLSGCCLTIKPDGSIYSEWLNKLNDILYFVFEKTSKIDDSISLLNALASRSLHPVTHFINSTIPKYLSMSLGVPSSPPNPLSFFHAIQACFSSGNHFQKMALICYWSELVSSTLDGNAPIQDQITNWRKIVSMKHCLKIQDYELEGLFLQ